METTLISTVSLSLSGGLFVVSAMEHETQQLHEAAPDDPLTTEAPCFETPEEQFEFWREELLTIVNKAQQDGVHILVCFAAIDPIARDSRWDYVSNGDVLTSIGLLELVREELRV